MLLVFVGFVVCVVVLLAAVAAYWFSKRTRIEATSCALLIIFVTECQTFFSNIDCLFVDAVVKTTSNQSNNVPVSARAAIGVDPFRKQLS